MLPLSDVKARLSEIAEEVDRTHERVHITRNGREYVVLVAAEDLESIEATLELLADPAAHVAIGVAADTQRAGRCRLLHARGNVDRLATDAVLRVDPAAQQRITQSQQEIARGEGLSVDQVEQLMAERSGRHGA